MKDQIPIEGHDGAFAAYIARPKAVTVSVGLRCGAMIWCQLTTSSSAE